MPHKINIVQDFPLKITKRREREFPTEITIIKYREKERFGYLNRTFLFYDQS